MPLTLYRASVPGMLQTLGATTGFLARGAAHCADAGIDPSELLERRLHPDMLPLSFQIRAVRHQSLGALNAMLSGKAGPPGAADPLDYAGLQALIEQTAREVEAVSADALNAAEGRDVVFEVGTFRLEFTAEDFLLSFAIPNLHFHATTAYDILRTAGVPLGKRDYLGRLALKT